jgi:hypothetical protein
VASNSSRTIVEVNTITRKRRSQTHIRETFRRSETIFDYVKAVLHQSYLQAVAITICNVGVEQKKGAEV